MTPANRGSEAGWVDENARSRTYRSTALSSTKLEVYARPKSIRTYGMGCFLMSMRHI